ncbi:MAG TPA: hypothetical protein VK909_07605 [Anaerolineales bacterium]|nr:hypothetical protein [Anaerolineales bacterium]
MRRPILENGFENNILVPTLSPKIQRMLDKAVEFMSNTKDHSHGMEHINHLLRNANRFFKATGDTFDIDKEILLLALYWHDVWKSQNKPAPRNYLFQQLYEGWGSMLMFKKYAKVVGLPQQMIRAVSYAIRKHSAVQLRPAKTLEAQLLWDMDMLDLWNVQRVQSVFRNLKWINIPIFDSYILYMQKIGVHFNFEWTKNEVKKRKPFFFEAMSQFRESLVNGNQKPETFLAQPKAVSASLYNFRSRQSLPNFDDKS